MVRSKIIATTLALALGGLADLAKGAPPRDSVADTPLAALARELAAGRLPLAAQSLWDRVLREAERGKPLARNDERREWALLTKLSARLVADCPAPMQAAMRAAFRARQRKIQQAEVA